MDAQYLPEVFALLVLIISFRPLVRRVGEYVNLWFLGWACLLVHYVLLTVRPALHGSAALVVDVATTWSLDLCGLCFVMAVSKAGPGAGQVRLSPVLAVCLGLPILLQVLLASLPRVSPVLAVLVSAAYLVPGLHLMVRRRAAGPTLVVVAIAYAVFGAAMLPLALHVPSLVTAASLALIFVTAAYLYARSIKRVSQGAVLASVGLASWGLSYPLIALYRLGHPGAMGHHALLELPQYLALAGIVLTLLEEHVLRTERMAMHDPLTDLPNRRLFEERLVTTMEEARLTRTTVACLVIDVDNFKTINDTLGHTAGDQLLRALAVRLSWHMSPRDILARTGGDEFTALLAGVTDEHHLRFIAGAMMSAASVPVAIDGMSVDVRISIGIALSPDDADDIDSLRRAADEAMYVAKRRGGSLLAFAGEA